MFVVAFALGLVAVFGSQLSPSSSAALQSWAAEPTTDMARDADVPQKARDVLAEIKKRQGEPPPGYVGGRTFGNRERRLPRGSYREYDVNPKRRGKSRGAERIVIEQRTGKAYYSRDHYETFTPMN
jgi:ribonuclease T1